MTAWKTLALTLAVQVIALTPAYARHLEGHEATDDTAYTLRPNEARLGIWKLEYAPPVDGLQIGSYVLPWLTWIWDVTAANANVKYQFWNNQTFATSINVGLVYLHLDDSEMPVNAYVLPFAVNGSWRMSNAWAAHLGLQGTVMRLSGEHENGGHGILKSAVAADSGQIYGAIEYDLSDVTSLILHGQVIGFTSLSAEANGMTMLDERTEVEFYGAAKLPLEVGANVGATAHWSWNHVNVKLGITYGNYVIPGINFVVPTNVPVPEFDFFVRF